jgi:hypothetical protein
MASTGAILYIKPRSFVTVKANRSTGAVLYSAVRFVSGIYTATDIAASANLANLKSWLPHRSVPVVQKDGTMTDAWYRFFDFLANVKIGGPAASTLPDVASAVVTVQEQAATVAQSAAGLEQQVAQNAESLGATVEVARNNSLTGANSIPYPQRTNQLAT